MRSNRKPTPQPTLHTHEGAVAVRITPEQALRRSILSCMLFEDEFYEDGLSIADRIGGLVKTVPPSVVADLAIEARTQMNLRHAPLFLLAHLAGVARGTSLISTTLPKVINRADELSEFLAIYAKVNGVAEGKLKPKLSNQVRKGLAAAFGKFSEYSLAKYNAPRAIRLRDVLFLSHPKPANDDQEALWGRLICGALATPDTWETELSAGKDKKATFTRLIEEGKLGYLALLRNLRNMVQAGVDSDLVENAILARQNGADRVLPFRFVAAARAAPMYEPALDKALLTTLAGLPALSGLTVVLVDVSESMGAQLSAKSDLTRKDAAATLASMIPGRKRVFTFADEVVEVAPRMGMAGVAEICKQYSGGTELIKAVLKINSFVKYDRLIVITDEQAFYDTRSLPAPNGLGYMINVASAQNGIGYGAFVHLDGFSEQVLRWIFEYENEWAKAEFSSAA